MVQHPFPQNVFDDLRTFITKTYSGKLPNSLIIAQGFIMRYPEYGREYGLSIINSVIEDGIKRGFFQ